MTITPTASAPSTAPLIQTPGKGSPNTIIGANDMTQALIAFGQIINEFIQLEAELSVQLASFQNTCNQLVQQNITNKYDGLGSNPSTEQVQMFSAYENMESSQGSAETQSAQTTLTGSTNSIQALQQSQNEFTTEAGSTVDTTLANDRIQ